MIKIKEKNQSKKSYVYATIGCRDGLHCAKALNDDNLLSVLLLEFYTHKQSLLLNSKYLDGRDASMISLSKIKILPFAFFFELLRIALRRFIYSIKIYGYLYVAYITGHFAQKYAQKNDKMLICDSYTAIGVSTNHSLNKLVVFQVHPAAKYLLGIYQHVINQREQTFNQYNVDIFEEEEFAAPNFIKKKLLDNQHGADFYLCASNFTLKSLVGIGVEHEKIKVVPYGVDSNLFKAKIKRNDNTFRIVYAGSFNERKNIASLISAWQELNLENSELIIIGDKPSVEFYNNFNKISFMGRLSKEMYIEVISNSDFLVLPSYAEGFGLVLLESLSCGTPFIATYNSGAPDILLNWKVGMLVDPFDTNSIKEKIMLGYNDIQYWRNIRQQCRLCAEYYTWERFREGVVNALKNGVPVQ